MLNRKELFGLSHEHRECNSKRGGWRAMLSKQDCRLSEAVRSRCLCGPAYPHGEHDRLEKASSISGWRQNECNEYCHAGEYDVLGYPLFGLSCSRNSDGNHLFMRSWGESEVTAGQTWSETLLLESWVSTGSVIVSLILQALPFHDARLLSVRVERYWLVDKVRSTRRNRTACSEPVHQNVFGVRRLRLESGISVA